MALLLQLPVSEWQPLALLLRRWCLGVSAATTATIASVGVMATGRLMLGAKRCRPCAPDGIDRHREFGALCRRAAVTTSANLNDSLLARGFSLEVIEATLADAERVCRSLLPVST